jgi:hypothetical protein
MKESATLDNIEAAIDAFSRERLRWLVGKGDVLIQEGELKKEHLDELLEKTVREEIERSFISKQLEDAPKTVSEIAKATKMEKERVLWNILAMMKWNLVEIKGEEKREYIYAIKEV